MSLEKLHQSSVFVVRIRSRTYENLNTFVTFSKQPSVCENIPKRRHSQNFDSFFDISEFVSCALYDRRIIKCVNRVHRGHCADSFTVSRSNICDSEDYSSCCSDQGEETKVSVPRQHELSTWLGTCERLCLCMPFKSFCSCCFEERRFVFRAPQTTPCSTSCISTQQHNQWQPATCQHISTPRQPSTRWHVRINTINQRTNVSLKIVIIWKVFFLSPLFRMLTFSRSLQMDRGHFLRLWISTQIVEEIRSGNPESGNRTEWGHAVPFSRNDSMLIFEWEKWRGAFLWTFSPLEGYEMRLF